MDSATTVQGVFARIHESVEALKTFDYDESNNLAISELEKAKEKSSFMEGKTIGDFNLWRFKMRAQRRHDALNSLPAPPTATEFWEAAYKYDPYGHYGTAKAEQNDMYRIIYIGSLKRIPLGTLRGEVRFELMPAVDCMSVSPFDPKTDFELEFADTESVAIAYPDGHPSEEQIHLKVQSDDDRKLRRFHPLGFICQVEGSETSRKTGHVLVMDMDRDRHPWVILASEWPDESTEVSMSGGDVMIGAQERVRRNDSKVHGVFPGDMNRTPIACLRYHGNTGGEEPGPMLLRI